MIQLMVCLDAVHSSKKCRGMRPPQLTQVTSSDPFGWKAELGSWRRKRSLGVAEATKATHFLLGTAQRYTVLLLAVACVRAAP